MASEPKLTEQEARKLLHTYLGEDTIRIRDDDYIGLAADGEPVILGSDELNVINYLRHCPKPEDW